MHIAAKPLNKYPLWLKPFFWLQKRHYGKVLKPGLLWGRVPRLFASVAMLYGAFERKSSPLSPVLRSLITVRVSQMNWCAFCVDINGMTLAKRAGSMDKIEVLDKWQDSDLFSEKEKAVLAYTEAVTDSHQHVTPELVSNVKRFFNDDELIELTGLIAFQNLSSKFNASLDVPADGFCKMPTSKNKN